MSLECTVQKPLTKTESDVCYTKECYQAGKWEQILFNIKTILVSINQFNFNSISSISIGIEFKSECTSMYWLLRICLRRLAKEQSHTGRSNTLECADQVV